MLREFMQKRSSQSELEEHDDRKERRLGTVYTNIAAYGSMAKGVGCVTVDASSATVTLALNAQSCNSLACPNCFIITGVGYLFSLTQCSAAYIGTSKQLGASGFTAAVAEIILINAATSLASISDGTTTNVLGPKSSISAYCYTGGSNALYFGNNYFNNGLHTGTGSSGTGASMTGAGALTLDDDLTVSGDTSLAAVAASSTLTVSGATTLLGTTQLGDAKTDTVTIKADLVADATTDPVFDYSGSTGTFKTSLGTKTIGGTGTFSITGALEVAGATSLNGNVDLGNAATDSVKFYGLVASSGTNAAFNIGTSALTAGDASIADLTVSGAATLQGTTALGNEAADTVTFNAHVASAATALNFDLSASTGTFATPQDVIQCSSAATTVAGAVAFGSTITVTGAATFNGDMALGDATADTVTIKGAVAVGTGPPAIDLGTSALTAGTLALGSTIDVTGAATFDGTVTLGDGTGTDTITLNGPITSGSHTHDFTGAAAINGPYNTNAANSAGDANIDVCVYDTGTASCTRSG